MTMIPEELVPTLKEVVEQGMDAYRESLHAGLVDELERVINNGADLDELQMLLGNYKDLNLHADQFEILVKNIVLD